MIKSHKPIKYEKNERLRFTKLGTMRFCDACGEIMEAPEIVFTCEYQLWLHLGCIENFIAQMKDFTKKYRKELVLELLK